MVSNDNGEGLVMPVQPMTGIPYSGGGYGGLNDSSSWLILFIILAMSGNWGGFGGNNNGNGTFPWLVASNTNTDNLVSAGFNQAATTGTLAGIQSSITSGFGDIQNALCGGFGNVQNSLCSGFAGVNASVNNAQNAVTQQMYANTIADLERSFAAQTAQMQGMNGLQSQLAQCCCDNRLATCQSQNITQIEGSATRSAISDGIRDLLTAQNAGFQSIKDQLCADKIEAKNDTIDQLRSELMYARGQASQDVQTAAIQSGQRVLANEIEQYVNPTPITAYMVQNPNCCYSSCNCNGGF